MRHGKTVNHLGRKTAHRHAMLSNMASSLILHKRISTTVAKAKELRKYVEPLITKSKEDTTHSRRLVFQLLQNKESVTTLFSVVSEKVADRPGGYTRIIKTGSRLGDNAEMCIIELVDFNEIYTKEAKAVVAKKTRRGKKTASAEVEAKPSDITSAPAIESSEEKAE
jgi:large subunit ribosomal protein L17